VVLLGWRSYNRVHSLMLELPIMTINLPDDLADKLQAIARQEKRTPEDFLRELLRDYPDPQQTPKQRTPGLGRGTIWVSDDFDAPLGDDFWLGDD